MRSLGCKDRERIFRDGSPAEWAALEAHAAGCASCEVELQAWRSLSVAARELHHGGESPALWQRIETALREQAARSAQRRTWRERLWSLHLGPVFWQTVLAGALVVALATSGGYLYMQRASRVDTTEGRLLKSAALGEVERTERAYSGAIEKLESETKPQLDNSSSPLIAGYREKLMVLDSAIDELRAQAGQNPSNAHLRRQLLAMYQEKQETLEEVLEMKRQ